MKLVQAEDSSETMTLPLLKFKKRKFKKRKLKKKKKREYTLN